MLNIKDKKFRRTYMIVIIFGLLVGIYIIDSNLNKCLILEEQNISNEFNEEVYKLNDYYQEWWDTDWNYRIEVLINNSANSKTLTNYLMWLNIPYYDGMKSDFDDVRFISSNMNELNYWIESIKLGNNADIWVNISSIPSLSTTTIYMYYGNPTATSNSEFLFEFYQNSTLDHTISNDYDNTKTLWELAGTDKMYHFGTPSGIPTSYWWDGNSWNINNPNAANGLPPHSAFQGRHYYYDEEWGDYMFYTSWSGTYPNDMVQWDGSAWVRNNTIMNGLTLTNDAYRSYLLFKQGTKKHLFIPNYGNYTWNGIEWIENNSIPIPPYYHTKRSMHLHYKFNQSGNIRYHFFPVFIYTDTSDSCEVWHFNGNVWEKIHVGKLGAFPEGRGDSSYCFDFNVIDNRLTLAARTPNPFWSSNLYFADVEPTYNFGSVETSFYDNFSITWENDASERKSFNFIDLNDDGKLELIRHMPNYETSIYTFTGNDCEFYDNIPIKVYEFGDYDGDGINELVGMPGSSYDYYFYYYNWELKILNLENIWDTGYDDRGKICFGDLDNDGKEEFVYADNGIANGGHEGRRRVISYDGTGFEELKSFDDPSTQGWDGIADATMIDIDGDDFDEIVYSWGYNSGFDGGIRIYDDSSHSYSLLKEYWFNRDPTFLDQFDDHEDLNGDGNEDLVVGMASTWIDNYRYIIFYDSSTSSFSYQQLVKQVSNHNSMYGVGKLFTNDLYGRYVSFFCPDSGNDQYWTDVIRIYSWLGTSFGDPIEIKLDKIYYNHYYDLMLRVRDINGDGYDEIIWDGSDSDGKQVTHFIFFMSEGVLDTTPPTWIQIPSNQFLEFGNPLYYDLNATDPSGIDQWWINDTINFQIDSNGVISNNSFLSMGGYQLKIQVNDSYDNVLTSFLKITVQDTTAPTWDQIPTDQALELGSGVYYDLNASDISGIDQWWINDTSNFNIDGDGIITNITSLLVEQYWLEIIAYDPYGLNCSAIIKIIVHDTTPPTWDQLPSDKTIEFGSNFIYNLNASDLSGIDQWWINDTSNFNIDGDGVITNITSLLVGQYWLEIIAYDPYILNCSAIIKITVQDTTPPSWDQIPSNKIIELGSNFIYNLNASDLSGIDHWWINDTSNFNIDGDGVITNITPLLVGQYWLEILAYDPYGLNCSVIIKITIQDTTPPSWIQIPSDKIIEFGSYFIYNLNASDFSGIDQWWINDTSSFNIDGGGVLTNFTSLLVGHYWLEILAYDPYGLNCSAIIKITVQDTTSPVWDQIPLDQSIDFGDTFSYDLNASDLSGIDQWWINDTSNFNIDGNGIITNITFLIIGQYWLEIIVYDPYGLNCSAIIKITVLDIYLPSWDQVPIDQIVEYGNNLIYDLNASSIWGIDQWWINDTLNFQISGNGTIINALPLSVGIYWLEVRAYNPYNTYCNAIITITVQDTIAPTFIPEIITNQIIEYGNSFFIDLNASDLSVIDHWWINDTAHFIINDDGVIVNLKSLSLGTYSLEVRVYDIYNNYKSNSFEIYVRDTIDPIITILAPEYNQSFGKFSPAYYILIDDLSFEEYGSQSIWYTFDGGITIYEITDLIGIINQTLWESLAEGALTIEFYVIDSSGNQGSAEIMVNKEDVYTPPGGAGRIPGYNILIMSLISLFTIILLKKKQKPRIKNEK